MTRIWRIIFLMWIAIAILQTVSFVFNQLAIRKWRMRAERCEQQICQPVAVR